MGNDISDTRGSELTAEEVGAWRGLLRVHAAVVKALDAELERTHGLSMSTYEVLIHLRESPDRRLRMAELADHALLSRSGMTRLVDRLERDGLLQRDRCSADARGCFACLTPKGEQLLEEARPHHHEAVRLRFLDRLDAAQVRALTEAWEAVVPGAASTPARDFEVPAV